MSKVEVLSEIRLKPFFYIMHYRASVLEILRHLVYLKKEYERFVEEYDELVNPANLKNDGHFKLKDNY